MKKILSITLLLIFTILSAEFSIETEAGKFRVEADIDLQQQVVEKAENSFIVLSSSNSRKSGAVGEALLPTFTQLVSLPASGNYQIENLSYDEEIIELDYPLLASGKAEDYQRTFFSNPDFFPENIVEINEPAIMRGERFSQLVINPVQYNSQLNSIKIYKNIKFELVLNPADQRNSLEVRENLNQRGFTNIFAQNIYGWQAERNLETTPELYLFIAPDAIVEELEPLAAWKRELGFQTVITPLSEAGSSKDEIKVYLQNAYDTWENAPQYVVLVGDESGPISVPSWFIPGYLSAQNVTDHPYTLLEGDDYFPDLMIGRLSCRNTSELHTIIQKIITYQKEPITEIDWFTRAIGIAVVNDWQGYYSGRETVMSARNKLLESTYTVVDTFITPYQSSTNQLKSMINAGATLINYRGFGSPSYWCGTYGNLFYIEDIESLNNGSLLPMVTSIVCGGGNFASQTSPTCFGERWLNAGTPSSPKGAIGFIGPSEHDTKVQFNNTNDLGIYQAIAHANAFGSAEMMLAGKMALYNSFPNNHEMDGYNDALDSDEFYFHVYNLLGDPGLKIWTDDPKIANLLVETEFNSGNNFIEVEVEAADNSDFLISLTSQDELITTARSDESGEATLIFNYLPSGEYTLTASKYGYIPEQTTIEINQAAQIQIDSIEAVEFVSGSEQAFEISLYNKSATEISGVEIVLSCQDDYLTVVDQPQNISIAAGGYNQVLAEISLDSEWRNQEIIDLKIEVNYQEESWEYIHQISINSPEFTFTGIEIEDADFLQLGELNQFDLLFTNTGAATSDEILLELSDSSGLSEISQSEVIYQPLSSGATTSGDEYFSANILSEAITGETLQLRGRIFQAGEIVASTFFSVALGDISETSPSYGPAEYYAIESRDLGNFETPEYNWIEIAPEEGGFGTAMEAFHGTVDGSVGLFELPFEFNYFGVSYDMITASTEGYLAMGESEQIYFRNRTIPSPVGPNAMIAPFWDDLNNGTVYGFYDSNNHMFVISWYSFVSTYSYTPQEFQVILFDPAYHNTQSENGMILFQYKQINNNDNSDNYATVGIENLLQTDGLLLSYADIYPETMHELANETAILFTSGDSYTVSSNETEIALSEVQMKNYPNPFTINDKDRVAATTIEFSLSSALEEPLSLEIFNIKGQKVWRQEIAKSTSLQYSVVWAGNVIGGNAATSGVYLYRLMAGNQVITSSKMLVIK